MKALTAILVILTALSGWAAESEPKAVEIYAIVVQHLPEGLYIQLYSNPVKLGPRYSKPILTPQTGILMGYPKEIADREELQVSAIKEGLKMIEGSNLRVYKYTGESKQTD